MLENGFGWLYSVLGDFRAVWCWVKICHKNRGQISTRVAQQAFFRFFFTHLSVAIWFNIGLGNLWGEKNYIYNFLDFFDFLCSRYLTFKKNLGGGTAALWGWHSGIENAEKHQKINNFEDPKNRKIQKKNFFFIFFKYYKNCFLMILGVKKFSSLDADIFFCCDL